MTHTLGTLPRCSLPRERLGKKAAGTWPLHACLHQPSTRLSGPLPSSSAPWSRPKSQNAKPFFSGSCQGYSGWYVKDVGLLAILGRQEPGGPCRGHEASRQGDCGRPGPLWVTSAVVQVPWRTKPRQYASLFRPSGSWAMMGKRAEAPGALTRYHEAL